MLGLSFDLKTLTLKIKAGIRLLLLFWGEILNLISILELVEKYVGGGGGNLVFCFGPNLLLQASVLDMDQAEQ